ncbi:glycosyltransferase [Granulicella sp. dw_53]|uniref:glycosyltransferase n=1 Tax=Granulicella sp. dw_53 TaxID=2719792 RepID=UPI001BD35A16|nr:glycosyltransferase [Granulicella sp. dw_53]
MKVLHIISSGGMYGAEAVILNLSHTLNGSGHSSILGVFQNSAKVNVQLHDVAVQNGIESHLIPCSGQFDRTVLQKIRALVSETQADVVHAHGYKADIYVYLALRGRGVPMVSTCHTWYDNDWMVTLYGKIDRLVLRAFAGVVAVSDEVKSQLLRAKVDAKKSHLIRNGINLEPFEGAAPTFREASKRVAAGNLLVGLVGRLAREKGVDLFLQAAASALKEVPEARFVVVGEGPDRASLEALIVSLEVENEVWLAGERADMPAVYASLDLMVSSSRQEGLPMSLLEGLASGRAVIATAVGAVPSVIENRVTGVLVPPENVAALSSAIVSLLQDAPRRRELGNAGHNLIAREFSAKRMTSDYMAVYEDVLAEQ